MKVRLTTDEVLRVFIVENNSYGKEVEVPDDLIQQFKKADSAFRKVEERVYELYRKSRSLD